MTVFISQPFGIGDVIFSMGIANEFLREGHLVVWPVLSKFYDSLKRAYPQINFEGIAAIAPDRPYYNLLNVKKREVEGNKLVVPIRWSNSVMQVPYKDVMRSKYDMYGLDWKIWKKDAMWQRYYYSEKLLMDFLGIQPGEKYNLINKRFGGDQREIEINVDNGLRNIYMYDATGFSLFDWSMTIENATTLHLVSSSTLYMTEVLDLKCTENHIYTRVPVEKNLDYVSYLFTKDYIKHE